MPDSNRGLWITRQFGIDVYQQGITWIHLTVEGDRLTPEEARAVGTQWWDEVISDGFESLVSEWLTDEQTAEREEAWPEFRRGALEALEAYLRSA